MVSEETHFGTVLLRLDVPAVNGNQARTEFYSGASIYRITPCDEQVALLVLKQTFQATLVVFQLPKHEFGQPRMFEQGPNNDEAYLDENGNDIPF